MADRAQQLRGYVGVTCERAVRLDAVSVQFVIDVRGKRSADSGPLAATSTRSCDRWRAWRCGVPIGSVYRGQWRHGPTARLALRALGASVPYLTGHSARVLVGPYWP